jgi:HK97 family phage major capsid protein
MDDTAAEGEMVAENIAATADDLSFGSVTLNAYKFSSKIIPISMEALQDTAVDTEAVVLDAIAMRIARGQNRKFTTGSGVAEPQGIVTGAALGKTGASASAITYDELVDTFHSLDPAYRDSGSCRWMMHDSTFQVIRKLKDGQQRPLWLPNDESAMNSPNGAIFNKPIVINQHMATIAAAAKTILFGDFAKYLIRDVMDVLILRFTDSAYASKAQVGFLAWARADGKLIDASNESIRYYRQL